MEYFLLLNRDHKALTLEAVQKDGFILPELSRSRLEATHSMESTIGESLNINVRHMGTKGNLHICLYSGLALPDNPEEAAESFVWKPLSEIRAMGDLSIAEDISGTELIKAYEEIVLKGYTLGEHTFRIWTFGNCEHLSNELAELVLEGKKRGCASLLWAYEAENEEVPREGDISIANDWYGKPLMILETVWVEVVPFNNVGEEQALSEGEGDMSVEYWRKVHWSVFAPECKTLGRASSEEMPIVCERFNIVKTL